MPKMIEEWRTVQKHPDYEVSSLGSFRRKACFDGRGYRISARLMGVHIQKYSKKGYKSACVTVHNKLVSFAPLVLEAFKGLRPSPKHVTRHLDDNVRNNHINNLEWGTQAENMKDASKNGHRMRGENHYRRKLTETQVQEIRSRWKPHSRTDGSHALAKEYGVHEDTIGTLVRGESWKHVSTALHLQPRRLK